MEMETLSVIEQLYESSLRNEILSLFNRARTKNQLIFAFQTLLSEGSEKSAEYFLQMLETGNQPELYEICHRKRSQFKKQLQAI